MLTIKVGSKFVSVYKFGPICFFCSEDQVMRRTLTCEEVPGSSVIVQRNGLEAKGFVCDTCLEEVKKEQDITVIE